MADSSVRTTKMTHRCNGCAMSTRSHPPRRNDSRVTHQAFVTTLLLLAAARAEDGNCTLCSGGEQMALPEKQLNIEWPVSAQNCTMLDEYASSLKSETEECAKAQAISSICGCPVPDAACRLCTDGSNITEVDKNIGFLASDFDGIAPTCELFEAFLHSVDASSKKCADAQLTSSSCGCPVAHNSCKLCRDDEKITIPNKRVPQYKSFPPFDKITDSDEWDFDLPTCQLIEALAYSLETATTTRCRRAQHHSFLCGCSTSDTVRKKSAVLAWLPRFSAPLSFFGSMFIICDVLKAKKKRQATQYRLLLIMSIVDCMSSIAWAFSTLPVPSTDEYGDSTNTYGAKGNDATCTAQAFFIQLGLISPFCNLSLAVYYTLAISYGWSENHIKKFKLWMFGIPIVTGSTLALAGIPFYGSNDMMCYLEDYQLFFLIIPLSTVIAFATLLMFKVYLKVYYQERAARRWVMRRRSSVSNLTTKVFWQAFWYLMSFYATWPILMVASLGSNWFYTRYGFMVVVMLAAPLQGFLNFITYSRPRLGQYFKQNKLCSCYPCKCPQQEECEGDVVLHERDNRIQATAVVTENASASMQVEAAEEHKTHEVDQVVPFKATDRSAID